MKVNLETETDRITCDWPAVPSEGDTVQLRTLPDGEFTDYVVGRVIWCVDLATNKTTVTVRLKT